MKLIHLSDLHLGKRFKEYSFLEDQRYILDQILEIIRREEPDGVLIAGDVYDKSVPSAEAVELLDSFLVRLSEQGRQVFLISGNHDCPERLAFGGRLMEHSGIHFCPAYRGKAAVYTLTDEYGPVNLYLLPFLKPANVRPLFPDKNIASYTDALAAVVEGMGVDTAARNVLVTHQFVTGAARCESEDVSVGGADNVDGWVFDPFDYVALGHIHGPQQVGRETVRYCGTPLKYSFSEAGHHKSVTVVELLEKGNVRLCTQPLTPLRDMVELRGSYDQVMAREFYQNTTWQEDYVRVTLTDEMDQPDGLQRLRTVYHNIMELRYDNRRTRLESSVDAAADVERRSPLDLLSEFYEQQNGQELGEEQREMARALMESIWEGEA